MGMNCRNAALAAGMCLVAAAAAPGAAAAVVCAEARPGPAVYSGVLTVGEHRLFIPDAAFRAAGRHGPGAEVCAWDFVDQTPQSRIPAVVEKALLDGLQEFHGLNLRVRVRGQVGPTGTDADAELRVTEVLYAVACPKAPRQLDRCSNR